MPDDDREPWLVSYTLDEAIDVLQRCKRDPVLRADDEYRDSDWLLIPAHELLYPQYDHTAKLRAFREEQLMWLQGRAVERLASGRGVAEVRQHWKAIVRDAEVQRNALAAAARQARWARRPRWVRAVRDFFADLFDSIR